MSTVLYFSKINVNSHIFEVYDDKSKLNQILEDMYNKIDENIIFYRQEINPEDGSIVYEAEYQFVGLEKILPNEFPNLTIAGSILKKGPIFINVQDDNKNLVRKRIENSEKIDFYFDINKEVVAYHSTQRFGYQEFNIAFSQLLGICMSDEDEEYHFEV